MHKTIEVLEKYCERITKELRDHLAKIEKSDTLTPADLDILDKLLHAMKSDKTVIAMLEHEERDDDEDDGYSGRYYNGQVYAKRNNSGGYSGRRMSRGYSRDSEMSDIARKLEDMMSRVRTEDEALAIRDALEVVNRM